MPALYFFDVVAPDRTHYDFHGHSLDQPQEALHVAETIAFDMEVRDQDNSGTRVEARDVHGTRLCSVEVRHADLIVW